MGVADTVARALPVEIGGLRMRLATVADLLVLKMAAAEEPRRRSSKRRQDLIDIVTLAEEHPDAAEALPDLKERVARLAAILLRL